MNNPDNKNTAIYGIHPVREMLKQDPKRIRQLFISPNSANKKLAQLVAMAKASGVLIKRVPKKVLDRNSEGGIHQGVVASINVTSYVSLAELLERFPPAHNPIFVVLDNIEDPHNLGAIIRSTHASGAQAVIIPSRRAAGITSTTAKAAAGSLEHCPVARVTNIANTIDTLNEYGFSTIATSTHKATLPWQQELNNTPVALVIGSEQKGIRRLVKEKCQFAVEIPMADTAQSYNASVAAGMLLYEAMRQRKQ